ncbi:MAG: tetratricopeptide repeat protein [Syntrophobacteraceae bacterium]
MVKSVNCRWFVFLLLLVFSCSLASCSSKEEKVAEFVAKGDRLTSEGDPVRGVLEYKNALQIDPKSAAAMVGMAKAYMAQKDYQKAFSLFRSALEVNPDLDDARVEVASLLSLGKQGQTALDELAKIKNPDAFQPRLNVIKARALFSLSRVPEAIDLLVQTKGSDQYKEAQMLLALAYRTTKDYPSMEKAVKKWIEIDSKDPTPYLFLAQYAAEVGDKIRVDLELKRMVQADPSVAALPLLRAQTLERLGLLDKAEYAFEELPNEPNMLKAKADFWVRRGDREKAKKILEGLVAKDPKDVESVIKLAMVLTEQDDRTTALKVLDNALSQDLEKPDREKALLAKATIRSQQKSWDEAQELCNAVLSENQGNLDAHLLLGKIFLATRKYGEAEIHLSQVATARPTDEDAQILLAQSQRLNKKESLYLDTLKRVLEAKAESPKARLELVKYYYGKKDFDSAAKILRDGLDASPQNILFLRTLGELEASQSDFVGAEREFRKIIALKPNLPLGYQEMGRLLLSQAKYDDAITWLKQSMDRPDGWQAAIPLIAHTYLKKKDKDAALAFVQGEALKRPDAPLAQYVLAQMYMTIGNLDQAEKAFQKASDLAPDWPDPYRGMAGLAVRRGNLAEAIGKVEEAYKKRPSPQIMLELASLYEHAGRYDDATRVYSEALKNMGESPILLNNLAYLYADYSKDKDKLEEAQRYIGKALSQQPDNVSFLDTAAWVAYKQGDLESAWNYIQEALLKSPDEGAHNLHAALIARDRGDEKQSLYYVDKALAQELSEKDKEGALALKKELEKS